MVFQDPFSSLSPRLTVREIITEPLRAHGHSAADIDAKADEVAALVGLNTGPRSLVTWKLTR